LEEYVQATQAAREADQRRVEAATIDDAVLEDHEGRNIENPLYYQFESNLRSFIAICGFSRADFSILYEPVEAILSVRHRGRGLVIGPMDAFVLFLRSPRSGMAFE
jgi:hypothetical protein